MHTNIGIVNNMTKQIFEKILSGGTLDPKDLTAEEKKYLNAVMNRYGMPQSTSYCRFFDKGFSIWEICGVSKLKEEFLSMAVPMKDGSEEEGTRGYGYVLTLEPGYDDSKFYDIISQLRIGVKLCNFMAERGMTSQMTVRTRFKANDWKPWELKGIRSIIEELFTE